jgi:hypothetical protein
MIRRRTAWLASLGAAALIASAVGSGPTATAATVPRAQPILQMHAYSQPTNIPSTFHFAAGGDASASPADTTQGITVVTPGPDGTIGVQIVPPDGKTLTPGTYEVGYAATGLPLDGSPDVKILTPTVEDYFGRLDVIDLASNSTGQYTRFDIVIEGVGEIRMGENEGGGVVLGSRHIEFSRSPVRFAPVLSEETVLNTGASTVAVGKPVVSGASAADFSVASSTCGVSLRAHHTCVVTLGFSPRAAGPRSASMGIRIGSTTQSVSLTGSAPLGTTSIVTSGDDYVDGGGTLSYVDGPQEIDVVASRDGWQWYSVDPYGYPGTGITADFGRYGGGPLALGTHSFQEFGFETSGYGTDVMAEGRGCGDSEGSENVQAFTLDSIGLPSTATITFTQKCMEDPTHPMTGKLLWQSRSDVTAPAAPPRVSISAAKHLVTWSRSTSSDAATTVARLVEGSGTGAGPSSGTPLYSGPTATTSAALPTLASGEKYTVVVFAVDKAGNVSRAGTASVGSAATIVSRPSIPTHLTATPGDGSITVRFSAPASSGNSPITGYRISVDGIVHSVTRSPCTLTGLPNGTLEQIDVQAVNVAGPSQITRTFATPGAP